MRIPVRRRARHFALLAAMTLAAMPFALPAGAQ